MNEEVEDDGRPTEVRTLQTPSGDLVREIPAEQLIKAQNARQINVPYTGDEYVCPNCERTIPTRKQRNMAKPSKFAHLLNDVQRCPWCSFAFSYRSSAVVLQG